MSETVLWSASPDAPHLPDAERYRISSWLAEHGLDPERVEQVAVLADRRTATVAATVRCGTQVRVEHVPMLAPPPVPWTAL